MKISERAFGTTASGEPVSCWRLENSRGMSAEILSFGAAIRAVCLPVGGEMRDLCLGFDSVAPYESSTAYLGATVGRVANRISGGGFELEGKRYALFKNDGENTLHGGKSGFSARNWTGSIEDGMLVLSLTSPDGDEGFPGCVRVRVSYLLGEDNSLSISYLAETDAPTVLNLTNHCYFNLNGSGSIEGHRVWVFSDSVSEIDAQLIPTGRALPVAGTALDLRGGVTIGEGIKRGHPQLSLAGGYDHNYIMSTSPLNPLRLAARVEAGGLSLECLTTQCGLQLYSGNFLDEPAGKTGAHYKKRSGLCLEAQGWPNAVNRPGFPCQTLLPGEKYCHETVYRFSEIKP